MGNGHAWDRVIFSSTLIGEANNSSGKFSRHRTDRRPIYSKNQSSTRTPHNISNSDVARSVDT